MRNLARAIGAACLVALLVVAAGAARQSSASSQTAGSAAKLERLKAARDYYRNLADPAVVGHR